jgi:hypothetical protein
MLKAETFLSVCTSSWYARCSGSELRSSGVSSIIARI